MLPFLFYERNVINILMANTSLEIELLNGVKIYKDKKAVKEITPLVNKYLLISEFLRFMQVPLEQ